MGVLNEEEEVRKAYESYGLDADKIMREQGYFDSTTFEEELEQEETEEEPEKDKFQVEEGYGYALGDEDGEGGQPEQEEDFEEKYKD